MDFLDHPSLWHEAKQLKRGQDLITPGQIEKYMYVVDRGALRIFYLSEEEEHTVRFAYKGSLFSSIPSFFDGSPGVFYVEALRESVLRATKKNDFEAFLQREPLAQSLYKTMLEHLVAAQIERELDLLTSSPQQRFDRVLRRSPQLFQEVPAKSIASYLSMTHHPFSRLSNK